MSTTNDKPTNAQRLNAANRILPQADLTVEALIDVPVVSVVMPVRNEEAFIENTIQQLLDQETCWETESEAGTVVRQLDFEIMVVDGRSTDETPRIVAEIGRNHPQVKLLDNPGRLSSSARNIGIENSRGDYIVIIDGHCEIPTRRYLVELVQAFERTGADCLGRPQPLDVTNATSLQRAIAVARDSALGHHPDSFIYSQTELQVPAISVAVAYRRTVFDVVGLFDTKFDACEDCELNHRIDKAGLKCYLIPQLAVRYQPRKTLRSLFFQLMRYGRGRIKLFRKHTDSFSFTALVPFLFLLGLLVGPIICLAVPKLWYVYFGVIALYALIVLTFSIKAAIDARQPRLLFWLPPVFVAVHLGSGSGLLQQSIVGLFSPVFSHSRPGNPAK